MMLFNKNDLKIIDLYNVKIYFKNKLTKSKWRIKAEKESLFIKLFCIIILIILTGLLPDTKLKVRKQIYFQFLNKKYESRNEAFEKSKNFIKNCLSSNLIKFESSRLFRKLKISVVIPMYNCEKYILSAIKSIQYQNISDIEILLIDDNSTDNTISLVEKIQKEDNRIKIIKNQKNMGILYSRSIGVLSSKGKYLFTLDNDDMFLNNDIFYTTLKLGENGDFDIIEFKAISNRIRNKDLLNNKIKDSKFSHHKSIILFQPELGRFPIPAGNKNGSYGLRDIFLWGKCIKTKIYQKALTKLGYDRYSRFMIRYEDILTNYIIFNVANSFICIQKYGIYHIERFGSAASIGWKKVSRNINLLYLLDIVIDFSKNNEDNKKLVAHLIIYYLNLKSTRKILTSNKKYMKLFKFCIQRILNSKFISKTHKNQIKNKIEGTKYIKHLII